MTVVTVSSFQSVLIRGIPLFTIVLSHLYMYCIVATWIVISGVQIVHGELTLYVIASNDQEQQEWISLIRKSKPHPLGL